MINSNMRCIETDKEEQFMWEDRQINSNMRCIETKLVSWDLKKNFD